MGSGRHKGRNIMGGGGNLVKLYSAWRGKGVLCFIQEYFQPQDQGRVKLEARLKCKFS